MTVEYQIIYSLLFMILVCLFTIGLSIFKLNYLKEPSQGIAIREQLPNIGVQTYDQASKLLLDEIYLHNIRNLILINLNCSQCDKLLSSLKTIRPDILENLRFIVTGSNEDESKISNTLYRNKVLFANLSEVTNELKVSVYPFIFQSDERGIILDKGFIFSDNITKYIN